jgi:hypothetical protein
MLTERATEFCGKGDAHDYELYLTVNEFEHPENKTRHLQTNGILASSFMHSTELELTNTLSKSGSD